jgi:hypothetical protein
MAKISAWLALLAGAAIAVAVALRAAHFDFAATGPVITAILLMLGAYRTLTAKSGGLRLLCGAWGLCVGMAWYAPSYNAPDFIPGMLVIAAPVTVSAIGLALVVLHKEQKKPV